MNRQSGSMFIEVMIALTVISVGLLGYFTSFAANFRATEETGDRDQVRISLENTLEFLRSSSFDDIYTNYNGAELEVPSLDGSDPYTGHATLEVDCYVNETALPSQFGPIVDLDGITGLTTADCSTTYKLLPLRLTLNYVSASRSDSKDVYVVLGER